MSVLIERILSILMTLTMVYMPFAQAPTESLDAENASELLLDVALFSDTHVTTEDNLKNKMLAKGLDNLTSFFPTTDAIVVSGDLTNGGKQESMELFYKTITGHSDVGAYVIAHGNHDVGHSPLSSGEARQMFIDTTNEYLGTEIDKVYYSTEVKGYKFIVMGDDAGDLSNTPVISDEQIAFIDAELADGTANGMPAFVICHWPLCGTNGLEKLWLGGGVNKEQSQKLKNVMEKYDNVYFITGHTHAGVTSSLFEKISGYSYVENKNGVNYISLPTYGKFNRHGVLWPNLIIRMEVYADHISFRPVSLRTLKWYGKYDKSVDIFESATMPQSSKTFLPAA